MARSISIVENKVRQSHFFLERMAKAGDVFFAAPCYFDAFAHFARGITFSMQAVISEIPGFSEWYRSRSSGLNKDPVARFFNRYRAVSTHIGDNVVRIGDFKKDNRGRRVTKYYFMPVQDLPEVPELDVQTVCFDHFKELLEIVFERSWLPGSRETKTLGLACGG
jgi:hypothetical protein